MIKALLKKQGMEMAAALFQGVRGSKRRSTGMLVLMAVLFVYAFGAMGVLFGLMADSLCEPLVMMGQEGLYFALMGAMATAAGVFGSIFTTYAGLYQAKDNEFLLSMPIPPQLILGVRMATLYLSTVVFEAIVLVPALVVGFRDLPVTAVSVTGGAAMLLVLPLLALGISCILGFLLAAVMSRVSGKAKNVWSMVLSLGFLAVYFWVYSKAYTALQMILLHSEEIGRVMRVCLYPVYKMGEGAAGSVSGMVLGAAVILLFFAAIYTVLSVGFLKLATTRRGEPRAKYRSRAIADRSPDSALLKREWLRFTGSSVYMLNCGLGLFLSVIAGAAALIKQADLRAMLSTMTAMLPEAGELVPLMAAAMLLSMASTSAVTAPSVSLEGKYIWLVQNLPVTPWQVLRAKLRLGLALTVAPIGVCAVCVAAALRLGGVFWVLLPMVSMVFAVFYALLGLWLNLLFPNLNWVNETVPVKQGASVALAMFGSWGMLVALGGLYWLVRAQVSAVVFLVGTMVLLAALSAALYGWLRTRGAKIFAAL